MWQIEFPVETDVDPEAVWSALIALETGEIAKSNGDKHKLHSKLEIGGTLTSSSEGIPPIQSTIVEFVDGKQIAIRTSFNGLILLLSHTVSPIDGGGCRLVRRLEITGDNADDKAEIAGPRISEDYPEAIAEVIKIARGR